MMLQALWGVLTTIGSIVFIDIILSGDNALVIGAAVLNIPRQHRKLALILGGGSAVLLRILFTVFAAFLLNIQYLQTIGGLLVLIIAIRLLWEQDGLLPIRVATHSSIQELNEEKTQASERPDALVALPSLVRRISGSLNVEEKVTMRLQIAIAVLTILVADITMSLDNIIAVGALARGQILFLALALLLSIVLLLIGSTLVSELLQRMPWLILIACSVLSIIASHLIWNDVKQVKFIHDMSYEQVYELGIYVLPFVILCITFLWHYRSKKAVSLL